MDADIAEEPWGDCSGSQIISVIFVALEVAWAVTQPPWEFWPLIIVFSTVSHPLSLPGFYTPLTFPGTFLADDSIKPVRTESFCLED